MDAFIQFIGKMYNVLFSNIGRKLQILAKVAVGMSFIGFICALLYVPIQLGKYSSDYDYGGLDLDVIGAVGGAYIGGSLLVVVATLVISWLLYAFGQLVDDIHQNRTEKNHFDETDAELPKL